ncbi:MAG: ATP synthase F1 subunit gamma [Solobacterium sp.]|jgi:F-type H+-transporting ATPase subunit gamma|nr:ATP synthase F1 subunit gamma [Solobacterium sp.]
MSQSRQALRSRIKSVDSTRKITKAMEMIANAKLVKQRSRMEANREYAQRLQDTVNEIVRANQDAESIFLPKVTEGTKKYTIIFCSDLGLCGGYNQNMLKCAVENLNTDDPVALIGTSLFREIQEKGFKLVNKEPVSSDKLTFLQLKKYVEEGTNLFRNGEVCAVQLIYMRFVNTMTFKPELDTLLPCTPEHTEEVQETPGTGKVLTLFEPDPETILNKLIPMMIQDVAYADWMESTTAEQGSRRVAMKTATDNADSLSEELLLDYNKARQAAITQEITEIVSGSNAV